MSTYAILLPCDGSEPLPISVDGLADFQSHVQGYIDAVSQEFDPSDFGLEGEAFQAVGYVNDEGINEDLPLNSMASVVFGRQLFGPVVIVSATSPSGERDGNDYDVPEWFSYAVFEGGLFAVSKTMRAVAAVQAEAVAFAVVEGVLSEEQYYSLMRMMDRCEAEDLDKIDAIVNICVTYFQAKSGYNVAGYVAADLLSEELTDEEIEEFWEKEGGN
jgi:hypothetical protein